jgi:hypothetical protein
MIQRFYTLLFALGLLPFFTACYRDCNCTKDQKELFIAEMNDRYYNADTNKQIMCKKSDGLWFVKKQNVLDWLFIYEEGHIEIDEEITVYNIPMREAEKLAPFFKYVRSKGYRVTSAKKTKEDQFIFVFEQTDGLEYMKQGYDYLGENHWKKTVTQYETYESKADFTH